MKKIIPYRVKIENEKFYKTTQLAYYFGLVHIAMFFWFIQLGVTELVYFNGLVSVPAFIIALILNRLGKHNLAFAFAFFELFVHQILATYFLGWNWGFHFWLFFLAGLSFFNPKWKAKVQYILLFIIITAYSLLFTFCQTGVYNVVDENILPSRLNMGLTAIIGLSVLIRGYSRTAHKANAQLAETNRSLESQRDQIYEQKKQITSSIEYASRIQRALLGHADEFAEVVPDNFVFFLPKDIVSGDFYWAKNVEVFTKKYKVFTAADCTGHGVPGAFMSMLGVSFLNEIILEFYTELNVGDMLTRLRKEIKKHLHQENAKSSSLKDGMDMALVAIDYEDMKLQFAGAYNPLFIIRNINGRLADEIEEIKPDAMPIGVYIKEKENFTNNVIDFNKGDIVYVFSDGFIDQFGGEKGDKYKKKRFKEFLLSIKNLPLHDQKSALAKELAQWRGNRYKQIDDVTVIGVRL